MSRNLRLALAGVVALVVVVGGGLYWYLRDDAPPAVDIQTAAEAVAADSDAADADAGAEDSDPADSGAADSDGGTTTMVPAEPVVLEGTWTVDAEAGEFDFESATGTFVGFRVKEQLSQIGEVTAVGRTGDVSGSIDIAGTTLTAAAFEVDLTTMTTNDRARDNKVQQALDTGQFPSATFVLVEPVELGDTAESGGPTSFTAVGDLTIHGVTNRVEFPLDAQLVGHTIVVVGSLELTFADYGVTPPTAPIVLSVEDTGILELQILLTKP